MNADCIWACIWVPGIGCPRHRCREHWIPEAVSTVVVSQ